MEEDTTRHDTPSNINAVYTFSGGSSVHTSSTSETSSIRSDEVGLIALPGRDSRWSGPAASFAVQREVETKQDMV